MDGTVFSAQSVTSTTYSGETDLDLTEVGHERSPLTFEPWTCPRCYFTGAAAEFQTADGAAPPPDARRKEAYRDLKPIYAPAVLEPNRDFSAWVRHDLYAQRLKIDGASSFDIGNAYHNAARVIRLTSAFPPLDQPHLDGINAALLALRDPKEAALPDWLECALNTDKLVKKGKKDSQLNALAAYQYHAHGEFARAQHYLLTLKRDKKLRPGLRDWAVVVEDEIYREQLFLEKALALYEQGLRDGDDWSVRYMAGDLHRRLGRPEKMEERFAAIQDVDVPEDLRAHVGEFIELGRRLAAEEKAARP